MKVAVSQAAPAILASSSTVILALLSLSFAVSPTNRGLGYSAAIGIATAVAYALVVLPAALLVFGRGLFWPFVPRPGQDEPTRTGFWSKVGAFVTGRPVPVAVASVLVLGILGAGFVGLRLGLSQNEQFRVEPESVAGQKVLQQHFPAGSSEPTTVITTPEQVAAVTSAAQQVDGVDSVRPSGESDQRAGLSVVLAANPQSERSGAIVADLRAAVQDADPGRARRRCRCAGARREGGRDRRPARDHPAHPGDRARGAAAPAAVGGGRRHPGADRRRRPSARAWVRAGSPFSHWFGFPAIDLGVPLLSFLFLVALGVDYNIFLATRAREEAAKTDTRSAIATALAVTGGVITSAGILLAAVFTVLGVLPLITLTQIGIIVGFGVLLDTLLVRSVLVPALVSLLGDRFWWPGDPRRSAPAHRLVRR